jgi:3-oxoacyl-[acyl-carrier-protein] synthase II
MNRRAVITGLGIVSPIGIGIDAFWRSALAGRSGIGRPTLFDASKLAPECQIVGEVRDFDPRDWMPGHAHKMAGRFSQFAVAAAKMAVADAHLDLSEIDASRMMVAIGTSIGGLTDVHERNFSAFLTGDAVQPWTVLEHSSHAATSRIAMTIGARGSSTSLSSACTAGLDAIAVGAKKVTTGEASVVIAGGTESPLSAATIEAFRALGALSSWTGPAEEASRPFDKLRNGLVLAEGAGVVVVEAEDHARARGVRTYAVIEGSAAVTEGLHMRQLDPTGTATGDTIQAALRAADVPARAVDYIAAHGNSLVDYDAAETAGIKRALGKHAWSCPVSSVKSMCGQPLAAGGAIQVVATCLAIRDSVVPPTINYRVRDPLCDLDYVPNVPRPVRVRHAVLHAQSIGGTHIAMVLGAPDRE